MIDILRRLLSGQTQPQQTSRSTSTQRDASPAMPSPRVFRATGTPSFDAGHARHCAWTPGSGGAQSDQSAPSTQSPGCIRLAELSDISTKALRNMDLVYTATWSADGYENTLGVFSRKNSLYYLFCHDGGPARQLGDRQGLQHESAQRLIERFAAEPVAAQLSCALAPFLTPRAQQTAAAASAPSGQANGRSTGRARM